MNESQDIDFEFDECSWDSSGPESCSPLNNIPVELKLRILSYLDVRDLLILCQISRGIDRIC